jgi:putative ABC transport system permease protein
VGSETSLPGRARETPDAHAGRYCTAPESRLSFDFAIARIGPDDLFVRHGAVENAEHIVWADPTIFDIFKFKVVAGNLENALEESNGLVITRAVARKYFGRDDPIGQTLEFKMITNFGR